MSEKLPPKILVAEHNEVLNAILCNTIERYWFDVTRVRNGEEALKIAAMKLPNIIVLSSRIRDMSGAEMLVAIRKIAELKDTPIIFLIETGETIINYITNNHNVQAIRRPYTSYDLMTTIKSLLRKSRPLFQDKLIHYKDISIDLSTFKITRGTKQIHLGPTDFKILQLFIQAPENIYSRTQIIDYVWGSSKDISSRVVDVHINRIRRIMKLEDNEPPIIKTARLSGYYIN